MAAVPRSKTRAAAMVNEINDDENLRLCGGFLCFAKPIG
jgi:hypothetical protein